MRHVSLAVGCLAVGLSVLGGEPSKKQLSQAEAEHFVFRSWREVATETGGKSRGSDLCVRFGAKGPDYWLWTGELVNVQPDPGERIEIDPTTDPMRIDFISTRDDKREAVKPCIWKVEGSGRDATLVIVKPVGSAFVRKDGKYNIRPTGFETTKENEYTKDTYTRCEHLEQLVIGEDKKKADGADPPKADEKKPNATPPEKKWLWSAGKRRGPGGLPLPARRVTASLHTASMSAIGSASGDSNPRSAAVPPRISFSRFRATCSRRLMVPTGASNSSLISTRLLPRR